MPDGEQSVTKQRAHNAVAPVLDAPLFTSIMQTMRTGMSLRKSLVEAGNVNLNTFFSYIDSYPLAANQYAQARQASLDAMAEDALWIADDPTIDANKARVMVDTRKWLLSKLAPKRYGDRLDVSLSTNRTVSALDDGELLGLAGRQVIDATPETK